MGVKCKIQYFLTERNQRVALNNTGCIPKSRIQKKSLLFQTNDGPNKPQNIKACLFINNLKQGTVELSSLSYFNTSLQWI